jgi:Fic family protein
MKTPKVPPDIQSIGKRLFSQPNLISEVLGLVIGPTVEGKYLHWDKLRYRTPPEGINHENWWFGIKMQRRSLFKAIPLTDKKDKPFVFLTVDPMLEILHKIDQGAGGAIEMPNQITNPDTKDRYYISSLIEEAITSSQLEGAATTRKVAKEMLRTGRRPQDHNEQMIMNNYLTMRRIGELKSEPFSKKLIFDIHRIITENILDDESATGRFRRAGEKIIIGDEYGEIFHEPPAADQLEGRLKAMCDFANGKTPGYFIHPIIRAIILHFWLAYDHPFVDGNGRTARALFYWSMLRSGSGYWLFEFVSISQIILKAPAKYGRAFLYTETDDNDLTYFILYHLNIIQQAIKKLHEYIKRKTIMLQTLERKLHSVTLLNHRQCDLISHALRHPHQRYTIESHRRSHNVVYQTSRHDLLNLKKRGLLEAGKIGRTWYFTPVNHLEKKLAEMA